jgi:LytS/YehU family sensor histidine kinase
VATWWQLATLVAWAAAAPAVLRAWRATRSASRAGGAGRGPTAPELAAHAAAVAAGAAVHALAMPLATRALFVPLGPAGVAGAAAWAFAAYLPLDALAYALVVGLGHASDAGRRARAAALRESAVRGELATARLAELRAQLRPHFLFNALNAATVLARRGDAEGAARVLGGLAELLRYVLGPAGSAAEAAAQLVPLDDELAFAGAYLAVERERFPERLRPAVDATAEARAALVPHLLLQPLVENAVQHGVGARLGAGLVTVRAWRDGAVLRVVVEDDGPGPAPAAAGGVGLANTRARLRTLYGDAATLTLVARPGGGAAASVALPYAARGGAP